MSKRKKKKKNISTTSSYDEDRRSAQTMQEDKEKEYGIAPLTDGIHKSLSKSHVAYEIACQANVYDNNVFTVNEANFFVDQKTNYYIYPNNKIPNAGYYNKKSKAFIKNHFTGYHPPKDSLIGLPSDFRFDLPYRKKAPEIKSVLKTTSIKNLREYLLNYPNNIQENSFSALFLAAMIAEPTRHTTAYITHILSLLNTDNDQIDKPAFAANRDDGDKNGALTMTRGGSDPKPENMDKNRNIQDTIQTNAKLDIQSIKRNIQLNRKLEQDIYNSLFDGNNERVIISKFKEEIKLFIAAELDDETFLV